MKRKPITQHEFSFTASAFNLAKDEAQDGQRIQREREQSERDRAEDEARQTTNFGSPYTVSRSPNRVQGGGQTKEHTTSRAAELTSETMPGLSPGSSWSMDTSMRKALANLTRGDR